jgi:hypothetical protein
MKISARFLARLSVTAFDKNQGDKSGADQNHTVVIDGDINLSIADVRILLSHTNGVFEDLCSANRGAVKRGSKKRRTEAFRDGLGPHGKWSIPP